MGGGGYREDPPIPPSFKPEQRPPPPSPRGWVGGHTDTTTHTHTYTEAGKDPLPRLCPDLPRRAPACSRGLKAEGRGEVSVTVRKPRPPLPPSGPRPHLPSRRWRGSRGTSCRLAGAAENDGGGGASEKRGGPRPPPARGAALSSSSSRPPTPRRPRPHPPLPPRRPASRKLGRSAGRVCRSSLPPPPPLGARLDRRGLRAHLGRGATKEQSGVGAVCVCVRGSGFPLRKPRPLLPSGRRCAEGRKEEPDAANAGEAEVSPPSTPLHPSRTAFIRPRCPEGNPGPQGRSGNG